MASTKIIELDETNTCKICNNALGKYSCPRCNILYCSLGCYQSEGHLQCSESFYKECVEEEISLDAGSEESKSKMKEILQRLHEQSSEQEANDLLDSDDECDNLVDRFSGIDLDSQTPDEIWDKLTDSERQEFVAFLRSGDVSKLIPAWEPWWSYHLDQKVVEVDEAEKYKRNCPELVQISDFSTLSAKPPADCVKYNIINVLAAYSLTARYFNGEHHDFETEAVSCVIAISLCLKSNENFDDFDTAVTSVEQECLNSEWILTDHENMTKMKEDVHHILKGPSGVDRKFYILSALSDFHSLVNGSLKRKDKDNGSENDRKGEGSFAKMFSDRTPKVKLETKDKIKQCLRKIDYFLSYTKDCFTFD